MLKKLLSYLLTCLLFFAIAGCSEIRESSNTLGYQSIIDVKREKYLIDSKDILNITVFDEPGLSMKVGVSDEGILSYPLIGDIEAKGLTTQEVKEVLEQRLKDGYLKNPEVTVMLDIAPSSRVVISSFKSCCPWDVMIFGAIPDCVSWTVPFSLLKILST